MACVVAVGGREHVRVAENEFFTQLVAHVGYVERLLFAAYLGIEAHVQQHVAQFLTNVLLVAAHQRVTQFVGFFYGVGSQAFVGLLAVPRAFHPQFVEHVEQSPERLHFLFSCMHLVV